jgi:DNA (cytosine-5)-methyltransferase 1
MTMQYAVVNQDRTVLMPTTSAPFLQMLPRSAEAAVHACTSSPSPEAIRSRRAAAGLTQTAAAALIHGSKRTWQDWEAGIARMHPGLWELFLFKSAGISKVRKST